MKTEERTQWLAALNTGDEVAYRIAWNWTIAKVRRVSPTRRFTLNNGTTVNTDGSIRGNNHFYIRPVTDSIRMSIWRSGAIQKARVHLKIDKLSNENLKVLLRMIDEQSE